MASTPSHSLPFWDLITYIIEYIDDLQTLKNFALVSRRANAVVERILWRNVIVDVQHIDYEWQNELRKGSTCPIRTLTIEKDHKEHPEWDDDEDSDERPPSHPRASFVKHLSLRMRTIFGETNYYDRGILEDTTLSLFNTAPGFFSELRSVRIDGEVTQDIWDTLLGLPSLRELRLWRTTSPSDNLPPLVLHGLSKLTALELGLLSPLEGHALGLALGESKLEKLHFSSTADDFGSGDDSTAAVTFLSAITQNRAALEDRTARSRLRLPLKELAIFDDSSSLIEAPNLTSATLPLFQNLTCLYLDLITIDRLPHLLLDLYLPHLTHLYLPFFYSSDIPDNDTSGAKYQPLLALLERHQATLLEFHLLNAVADKDVARYFQRRVDSWLCIEEVRVDSVHTDDHHLALPAGLEWTRTGQYLGVDGRDFWGRHVCRARLDRFDLTSIHEGFLSNYVWQKLKVLVLNPGLAWHEGLFPEPHDHVSPRIRDLNQRQALGLGQPLQDSDCAEKEMAERIVRRLKSRSIRVIAIRQFRFWVDLSGRVVWYLQDALEDTVQGPLVRQLLCPKDWAFLSERSMPDSFHSAGVATFVRRQPEESSPATSAIVTSKMSLEEEFALRVKQVLDGRSAKEFLQLPLAERKLVLGQLLVASEPIWIWDEGEMDENDDSIAEDATILLQDCCTGSNQLSLDAQEVYYGQNVFRVPLHGLGEFLCGYEPHRAKDFVQSLVIRISVSSDGLDDMDDLLQLLDCKQIQQIKLELAGSSYSDIDKKLYSSRHILEQLSRKIGGKLQIAKIIS